MEAPLVTANYIRQSLKELPIAKWVFRSSNVPDFAMKVLLHYYEHFVVEKRSSLRILMVSIAANPVARNILFINLFAFIYRYPEDVLVDLTIADYFLGVNLAIIIYALSDSPMNKFLRSMWIPFTAISVLGVMTCVVAVERGVGIENIKQKMRKALSGHKKGGEKKVSKWKKFVPFKSSTRKKKKRGPFSSKSMSFLGWGRSKSKKNVGESSKLRPNTPDKVEGITRISKHFKQPTKQWNAADEEGISYEEEVEANEAIEKGEVKKGGIFSSWKRKLFGKNTQSTKTSGSPSSSKHELPRRLRYQQPANDETIEDA